MNYFVLPQPKRNEDDAIALEDLFGDAPAQPTTAPRFQGMPQSTMPIGSNDTDGHGPTADGHGNGETTTEQHGSGTTWPAANDATAIHDAAAIHDVAATAAAYGNAGILRSLRLCESDG